MFHKIDPAGQFDARLSLSARLISRRFENRGSLADNSANAETSAVTFTLNSNFLDIYRRSRHCIVYPLSAIEKSQMTLKIEKVSAGRTTIIRLNGRLQSEHLDELRTQVKGYPSRFALDLDGVMLVDVEVVRFLRACEVGGVELLHCSPYIREWTYREQDRKE